MPSYLNHQAVAVNGDRDWVFALKLCPLPPRGGHYLALVLRRHAVELLQPCDKSVEINHRCLWQRNRRVAGGRGGGSHRSGGGRRRRGGGGDGGGGLLTHPHQAIVSEEIFHFVNLYRVWEVRGSVRECEGVRGRGGWEIGHESRLTGTHPYVTARSSNRGGGCANATLSVYHSGVCECNLFHLL